MSTLKSLGSFTRPRNSVRFLPSGLRCHARNFRCKFHGWLYALDGRLAPPPSAWDFRHAGLEEYRLPQAKVGRWGGFVFVNLDENAIPLEDYIKDIPEHFAQWNFENRFLAAHVGQVIRANWKVAVEAFLARRIAFADIARIVGDAGDVASARGENKAPASVAEALAVDHVTRERVRAVLA